MGAERVCVCVCLRKGEGRVSHSTERRHREWEPGRDGDGIVKPGDGGKRQGPTDGSGSGSRLWSVEEEDEKTTGRQGPVECIVGTEIWDPVVG